MTGTLWWSRLVNSVRFLDDAEDSVMDERSVILLFDTEIPWQDIMLETIEQRLADRTDNRTFDVFKPVVGDIIGIVDDIATATVGSYLIADDEDGFAVEGSTHTAGNTAVKVLAVEKLAFPRAGIGDEFANVYVAEVVEN